MAVLINFKICDNDKACDGMRKCPNKVFSWNEEKESLEINNDLCINCGICVNSCMVSAIKTAKTEEEFNIIKKEIEDDPRTINDLFIDRYGAVPIDDAMIGNEEELDDKMKSKRSLILELYNEDSIHCLLKSIPIKEILQEFDIDARYRKIELVTDKLLGKYNIRELPALVFIKDKEVIGVIDGYYTDEECRNLFKKIHEIKENIDIKV